jgi:2-oxoglutarate ferredoxin oxidoreductase subunit alpha
VGWEKAKEVIRDHERRPLTARKDLDRLLISGDEAIGLGALVAGCRVFAAYPICPASEIWQWLIRYLPRFNGAVVQTEDEVAALNMTLGAAYAGARAMTSTSGPGASLMMEAFSLSGMAEIPVVVAHVQRLGPGTGIPTKTAQGDTNQWIFGSHGEFPRIVLSPGTVEESFEFTVKAFNLAEKYQCPVIVLTELALGQNYQTVRTFDLSRQKIDRGKLLDPGSLPAANGYKRYKFTPDGVSARAIPSMKNGVHMVEGNEHDEKGYRNEEPENRARMMEKRMRKLRAAAKEVVPPKTHGDQAARIGMIGYGATLGPSLEAIAYLKKKGTNVKFLQLRTLWPFPAAQVEKFLEGCRSIFVVENNYSGQLQTLIRSQVRTDWEMSGIRKYTTATFRPGDIVSQVQGHLRQ